MRALIRLLPLIGLLMGGCASTPVHSDGISSSVAWHATEVQLTNATVQGRPGERYAFTLASQENEAASHSRANHGKRSRHPELVTVGTPTLNL
jgi:hypothetical protein